MQPEVVRCPRQPISPPLILLQFLVYWEINNNNSSNSGNSNSNSNNKGHLMLRGRFASQTEVIRAVVLEDSPCFFLRLVQKQERSGGERRMRWTAVQNGTVR